MADGILLPPSATLLERRAAEACADATRQDVPIRDLADAAIAPVVALPWLAWQWSVDEWDPAWSDEQKRAAIGESFEVHRRKGTIGAVRRALAAIGIDVRVQEWFAQTPAAAPYTFRVLLDTNQVGIPEADMRRVIAVIERTKNLRSHLTEIAPSITSASQAYVAGAALVGNEVTVTGFVPGLLVANENTICI